MTRWRDTSKPDSVSTLGYHWTDHTGRPPEPQVHWDATGTTLADAKWCSSGDPVLMCIIGTHWKTTEATSTLHWEATGTTVADASIQWYPSGDPVLICIIGTHWKATGSTLETHWLPTIFLQWHSSVHWGLSSRHTGLPLEDQRLRVREGRTYIRVLTFHCPR